MVLGEVSREVYDLGWSGKSVMGSTRDSPYLDLGTFYIFIMGIAIDPLSFGLGVLYFWIRTTG